MPERPFRYRNCCAAVLVAGLLAGCGGGSSGSPPAPTPTPDTAAPGVPTGLVATAASDSRIDLSWSASTDTGGSGLAGYRVFRDGAATALATVTAPATSYADTGLSPTTSYSYTVRAFDGAQNESGGSTAASATTSATPPAGTSGLDSRPSNTSCLAWERPATGSIQLERFTSLSFSSALGLLQAPNDNSNWYVLEQGGTIRRFQGSNPTASSAYGTITVTSGGETGLLGMAFHPDFPSDNRVFLSYTLRVGGTLLSRISSFASTATALGTTETILLSVEQPADNHNGGHIQFGPDGYLYIGLGDGGSGGDPWGSVGNGQRLTTMLGKMLRIDVDNGAPYRVPTDNPFYSAANPTDRCPAAGRASGNCPEIYAWGLRNPWRWSFDRVSGELWLADVGQGEWEEVNTIARGGNYGWRCREGAHDFNPGTSGCNTAALIDPVTEYSHSVGNSITGGFVYRGPQTTPLKGRYLFGDFGSGRIWAWLPENATPQAPRTPTQLTDSSLNISSFAEGNDGEMYVVHHGGTLHRIVFQAPTAGGTVPTSLSATGCVSNSDPRQPAPGLIPYALNAPFWSDGATKQRWIGLPDGQSIGVQAGGDWNLPNGTVLMKHFTLGTQLIETRLFMRHPDGTWGGFTYAWNDAQTDATLVQGGSVRSVGGQQWIYPSEGQCVQCHTNVAGGALGPETAQLNRSFTYPQTGRTANQLFTLNHIQTLNPAITNPAAQPSMPDPADTTASLDDRARAYLHTNCSQCHRTGGPTPSTMDLRYTTPLNQTNACEAVPQAGELGLGSSARLIDPGNAANSIIVNRTNRRDANAMPPVGSNQVDTAGVALLTQWINGLAGC